MTDPRPSHHGDTNPVLANSATVREWDNDYCRACGQYLDPERGLSVCDTCRTTQEAT